MKKELMQTRGMEVKGNITKEEAIRIVESLSPEALAKIVGSLSPEVLMMEAEKNTVQVERVERVGNVSFSLVEGGRQPVSGAFYYIEPGKEGKKRTTVRGRDEAEVYRKIEKFLEKKNREYLAEMEQQKREYLAEMEVLKKAEEAKNKPKTFAEAGDEWFEYYESSKGTCYQTRESHAGSLKAIKKR